MSGDEHLKEYFKDEESLGYINDKRIDREGALIELLKWMYMVKSCPLPYFLRPFIRSSTDDDYALLESEQEGEQEFIPDSNTTQELKY